MLTLLLVGLAGCSSAATPGGAAGSGAADPSGSAASPPSTPGAGSAGGSGTGGGTDAACPKGVQRGEVTVTEVDNHTSVCLSKGTRLDVYLHARMDQQWSKPTPQLAVLQPTANGRGALAIGVTAGFFTAASTGQTRVTAQLAPCKGPKPGPACDAVELFEITVTVR